MAKGTAEARSLAHPPSLIVSLAYAAALLSLTGDDAALDERADELVAVTTEHGFPTWGAHGTIYSGWAKVRNGDMAEGISLLRGSAIVSRRQRRGGVDAPSYRASSRGMRDRGAN